MRYTLLYQPHAYANLIELGTIDLQPTEEERISRGLSELARIAGDRGPVLCLTLLGPSVPPSGKSEDSKRTVVPSRWTADPRIDLSSSTQRNRLASQKHLLNDGQTEVLCQPATPYTKSD